MMGNMQRFVDDDSAYLAWLANHRADYVINTYRNPSAGYLMLHRANCYTISGVPSRGSTFTGDFIKVCGSRVDLEAFARELGGNVTPCGICLPDESRLNGQGLDRSRYSPLRNYLAGYPGSQVKMTFAEVEHLVGKLPDSARLHRAWWSNTSSTARAWRDAGWHLQSVDQAPGWSCSPADPRDPDAAGILIPHRDCRMSMRRWWPRSG